MKPESNENGGNHKKRNTCIMGYIIYIIWFLLAIGARGLEGECRESKCTIEMRLEAKCVQCAKLKRNELAALGSLIR